MKKLILLLFFAFLTKNLYSQNGWVPVNSGTTKPLAKSFFLNINTGWVCGDSGVVIKTTNKGFTWSTQSTGTTQLLKDIFFINENTGWAVGGRFEGIGQPSNRMFIIKTVNGGTSWFNQLDFSDWDNVLVSVYFFDANTGMVFGSGGNGSASTGVFRKTTDGGVNWSYMPMSSTTMIKADNSGKVWRLSGAFNDVGMDSNWISYTSNRGDTWETKMRTSRIHFRDIDLVNGTTPLVLADSGSQNIFFKSLNSGASWIRNSFTLPTNPTQFEFVNENTGWAGRNSLYYTTNSGINWSEQINPSPNFIIKAAMFDSVNGICIAGGGKIYITSTGGVVNINNPALQIPDKYFLSQNYPNPFNPTTNINYELPIGNYVQLKVYDALGNEVETLVNEKQNAGSYSVYFNATSLPSGIYFYKLVTENFSETKKMILVK